LDSEEENAPNDTIPEENSSAVVSKKEESVNAAKNLMKLSRQAGLCSELFSWLRISCAVQPEEPSASRELF
jgi:hypothetical protein